VTHGLAFVLEPDRIPVIHVCHCGREFNDRALLESHVEGETARGCLDAR
jgi:hypothetical protein